MAGVPEAAQALVKAIRASGEYREWERLAKQVQGDAQTVQRLSELRQQTFEIQAAQLQGQKIAPNKLRVLEQATEALQTDMVLGPYLRAEWNLTQLLGNIQEALSQTFDLQIPGGR